MADNFDTDGMASALDDVTNPPSAAQPAVRTEEMEANAAKAREVGWTAPQPYDYDAFNAAPQRGVDDLTEWGHKAAKYEWTEEFGDTLPRVPALEEQLFGSELRNRQGKKLEKYDISCRHSVLANLYSLTTIKVTAESTDRPKPIKSVSHANTDVISFLTL